MSITENEAYLIAKRAWKVYSRKKTVLEMDQCLPDTIIKLRSSGYKEEDIIRVKKWIKALRRGQKYPY